MTAVAARCGTFGDAEVGRGEGDDASACLFDAARGDRGDNFVIGLGASVIYSREREETIDRRASACNNAEPMSGFSSVRPSVLVHSDAKTYPTTSRARPPRRRRHRRPSSSVAGVVLFRVERVAARRVARRARDADATAAAVATAAADARQPAVEPLAERRVVEPVERERAPA